MCSPILILSSFLTINSVLIFIGLLIFVCLLLGKIAPKLGFGLIILISAGNYLPQLQPKKIEEQTPKQTFVTKDTQTIKNMEPTPKSYDAPTPLITQPKKAKIKKETPKYITKVQIEGISNPQFIQRFEKKSGYSSARKGDYTITFSYSGTIKKGNHSNGSRFIYSGGNLTIQVGSERCCCNGVVSIPKNIPLGKSMKEGLKIMSLKVEEYALKNLDVITPMIVDCLPKY